MSMPTYIQAVVEGKQAYKDWRATLSGTIKLRPACPYDDGEARTGWQDGWSIEEVQGDY